VRRLQLGELILHDVPVLVADAPALLQAGGQATLGIDVLYHLRCTLDYPGRRCVVEAADTAASNELLSDSGENGVWEIPLRTFSHMCLAEGRLPSGDAIRTLIDTGNSQGTFLSSRWAARRAPDFPQLRGWIAQHYYSGRYAIADWQLAGHRLTEWPVRDRLPAGIEQLDAVDLLVGQDLLGPYCVEIDLSHRRLRLSQPRPMMDQ
jgi:hypothetical protein